MLFQRCKQSLITAVVLALCLGFSLCQAGDKLSKTEQNAKAKAIFTKLSQTPQEKLDVFNKGYREVIEQCPDTEYAEVSCWRLSNLLILGYEPARKKEAVTLLEYFLKTYPNSKGVAPAKQRLVRLYEDTKQYCKAADLYSEVVPSIPVPPNSQGLATWVLYADALKECGRKGPGQGLVREGGQARQGPEFLFSADSQGCAEGIEVVVISFFLHLGPSLGQGCYFLLLWPSLARVTAPRAE